MSEMKCKRCGTDENRIDGFCSIECRDAFDYEEEIAELEEQVWNLNLENERLEEAYWIDESIAPDGTLKPSVRKLLERLEKAETDLRLSDGLVKALDNRIAELEAERRWIPVSERLPEDLQSIIVFTKDRKTYIIRFLELYGREGFGSLSDIVTHWMPLPESPESEE